MKFIGIVLVSTTIVAFATGQSLDDCLRQDSISCVQKSLYRKAKEFFEKESLEFIGGVSLVKTSNEDGDSARNFRAGKEIAYDREMDAATDVVERQNVLENFVGEEAGLFLTGRSLRINFAPAIEKIGESARAIRESVPAEIRQAVDEVVEGRGKKKILKSILPLLIAAKVKIGALATLAYFAIGLLAKKAILASLISIAISAFIGLKALWSSKSWNDVTAYSGGWSGNGWGGGAGAGWSAPVSNGGWSSSGSAGWDDGHGYAQNQAYSGYHH